MKTVCDPYLREITSCQYFYMSSPTAVSYDNFDFDLLIQCQRCLQWSCCLRKALLSWGKGNGLRSPAAPPTWTWTSVSSGISLPRRWDWHKDLDGWFCSCGQQTGCKTFFLLWNNDLATCNMICEFAVCILSYKYNQIKDQTKIFTIIPKLFNAKGLTEM